jgi:hypothetical protein
MCVASDKHVFLISKLHPTNIGIILTALPREPAPLLRVQDILKLDDHGMFGVDRDAKNWFMDNSG